MRRMGMDRDEKQKDHDQIDLIPHRSQVMEKENQFVPLKMKGHIIAAL